MGLIKTLKRWRHVYGWRLRYWWLDTPNGRHARVLLLVLGFFGSIAEVVVWVVRAMQPVPAMQPHQAINWFIAIVFGIGVAYLWDLTKGKADKGEADNNQAPTTDDGQSAKHHFGTCWVDDSFLLAWKIVSRDPIKSDGGKK